MDSPGHAAFRHLQAPQWGHAREDAAEPWKTGAERKGKTPMKGEKNVSKEKLIRILQSILQTDIDLSFLLSLEKTEIETLVACVRNRVDHPPK